MRNSRAAPKKLPPAKNVARAKQFMAALMSHCFAFFCRNLNKLIYEGDCFFAVPPFHFRIDEGMTLKVPITN